MKKKLINLYVSAKGVVTLEPVYDDTGKDLTEEIIQVEKMPKTEEKLYYKAILMHDGNDFYSEFKLDEDTLYQERHRALAYLHRTDHKVLKMYEAQLLGNSLPYDLDEIKQRVIEREKLKEIDEMIASL